LEKFNRLRIEPPPPQIGSGWAKEENTRNQTHKQKICIECGKRKLYEYLNQSAKNLYWIWQEEHPTVS